MDGMWIRFLPGIQQVIRMIQEGWIEVSNPERTKPSAAISVYPSPADQQVTVEFPGYINTDELHIFDVSGTLVKSVSVFHSKKITFNIDSLPPGIYLMALKSGAAVVGKLMVD